MPPALDHSSAFRTRRFLNWFPLGLAYAFLYMGRYNLTVAKNSLGQLMTKEDFGIIFFWGTIVYAFAFLVNGPLVDRLGGRKGMLISVAGAAISNLAMGAYLQQAMAGGAVDNDSLRVTFSVLYAANMYFQSYGAVSIVKVNARWFHVSERGGFSGIFGTMISSGIFLAFTVNSWLLDTAAKLSPDKPVQWVVFYGPAILLATIWVVELFMLRDKPSDAGHADFELGDASSGDNSEEPISTLELYKRLLTHPIILTIGAIEFCTGVLRNGVMHWFPIYSKEVWALSGSHPLVYGVWDWGWAVMLWVPAAVVGFAARKVAGRRGALTIVASLLFLTPFVTNGGWGGILFAAGVLGGNVAGWVSDLFFQSRRGPAAAGLYGLLAVCTAATIFAMSVPTNQVGTAKEGSGLEAGDRIVEISGKPVSDWADVRMAVACVPATCVESTWDAEQCQCSIKAVGGEAVTPSTGVIPAKIERGGQTLSVDLTDPAPKQRAGDWRMLKASPVLPLSPYVLGALVFVMSLCVIGTHGLLSGTATMDFGGRKAAGTAVGVIDGMVYLGTALQSISLGYLTTRDWGLWPVFLVPFAVVGFGLCLRIWNAKPGKGGGH